MFTVNNLEGFTSVGFQVIVVADCSIIRFTQK